ncbi:MAG: tRNA lysidine(34) synthetase TilS [Pseudomonadota bacterium]
MASSRKAEAVFSPARLDDALRQIGPVESAQFVCAVSGGADSMALVHAMAQLGYPARGLYIDHGLHTDSATWGDTVVAVCRRFGFEVSAAQVAVPAGSNLEARARTARYRALADALRPGDILLTAHHRDDQALTMLLQLMRGAGLEGLSAMPARAEIGVGEHWRPLLRTPAQWLTDYVERERIAFIDDPSNSDTRFDRNYLRHEIAPRLTERWPAFARTVSRSARHCARAAEQLRAMSEGALPDDPVALYSAGKRCGEADVLLSLRQRLRARGVDAVPARRLTEFVRQCREAGRDTHPSLRHGTLLMRRFHHWVYLTEDDAASTEFDRVLSPGERVALPGAAGEIRWLPSDRDAPALRVRSRRGGERFGRRPSRRLKSFLNEHQVLPWRRQAVPLVCRDGDIVAIGTWWMADDLGGQVEWHPAASFTAPPTGPAKTQAGA